MMTMIWNKTLYWEVSVPELEENNEVYEMQGTPCLSELF